MSRPAGNSQNRGRFRPGSANKPSPRAPRATFAFQFSGTDGQTLVANAKKARDVIESAKNRSEMFHAMPDWWAKSVAPADPKLAPARLVPMIKGFIGQCVSIP